MFSQKLKKNTYHKIEGTVYKAIETSDGKIIIAGNFNAVGGIIRNHLARLNADGTLDETFPDLNIKMVSQVYPVSDIIIVGNNLYLAGGFYEILGEERIGVASINLNTYSLNSLNLRVNSLPENITLDDNKLFFTGSLIKDLNQIYKNTESYNSGAFLNPTTGALAEQFSNKYSRILDIKSDSSGNYYVLGYLLKSASYAQKLIKYDSSFNEVTSFNVDSESPHIMKYFINNSELILVKKNYSTTSFKISKHNLTTGALINEQTYTSSSISYSSTINLVANRLFVAGLYGSQINGVTKPIASINLSDLTVTNWTTTDFDGGIYDIYTNPTTQTVYVYGRESGQYKIKSYDATNDNATTGLNASFDWSDNYLLNNSMSQVIVDSDNNRLIMMSSSYRVFAIDGTTGAFLNTLLPGNAPYNLPSELHGLNKISYLDNKLYIFNNSNKTSAYINLATASLNTSWSAKVYSNFLNLFTTVNNKLFISGLLTAFGGSSVTDGLIVYDLQSESLINSNYQTTVSATIINHFVSDQNYEVLVEAFKQETTLGSLSYGALIVPKDNSPRLFVPITISGAFDPGSAAINDGVLYLSGSFNQVNNTAVSKLVAIDLSNGQLISSFNPTIDGIVYDIQIYDQKLHLCGEYTTIDSASHIGVAILNGDKNDSDFGNLSPTQDGLNINACRTYSKLNTNSYYVGGSNITFDNVSAKGLVVYNKTNKTLQDFNIPTSNMGVTQTQVVSNTIYVSGNFTTVSGTARNFLAAFDLTTGNLLPWNPNPDAYVGDIKVYNNKLYVGGGFTTIDGVSRTMLAAFDIDTNGQISQINASFNPTLSYAYGGGIKSLAVDSSFVYAMGVFDTVNSTSRTNFAVISHDGTLNNQNIPLTSLLMTISNMYSSENNLIFTFLSHLNGSPVRGLAIIDKTNPQSLTVVDTSSIFISDDIGFGTPYAHYAEYINDSLVVGGLFGSANGLPRNGIAVYNKSDLTLNDYDPNLLKPFITYLTSPAFITGTTDPVNKKVYLAEMQSFSSPQITIKELSLDLD